MPLPHTTPEQREPFYEDIEAMLLPGFLSHPVVVQDTPLCLRTLGPGDMFALQARMTAPSAEWRVWTAASAVWMVNGISILDEPGATPRMAEVIRGLPRSTQEILFAISMGLFARQNRASRGVESFCYEVPSRYQWRSMGGNAFVTQAGVPGVERLGTNHVQRMWVAFNTYEDQRERDEVQWDSAKLSASAMSPKGVQKLDARDQDRRAKEHQRRQTVQDYFYYWALGILDNPNPQKAKTPLAIGDSLLGRSKTVEELEDEMRRWVSGEEDWHDKVIREYKKQIIDRVETERVEQEQRMAALQAESASRGEDMRPSTALVGYTPQQLATILDGRQAGPPGVKPVAEGGDRRGYLYGRYIEKVPSPGHLRAEGGRLIAEGDEEGRLAAEIAQRRVTFSKGE